MGLKRFLHYDAAGTDGSDLQAMWAVYEVIDAEGFSGRIAIPAAQADGAKQEDAALNAVLAEQPSAKPIEAAQAAAASA